jgi:hypothetical protein
MPEAESAPLRRDQQIKAAPSQYLRSRHERGKRGHEGRHEETPGGHMLGRPAFRLFRERRIRDSNP